MFSGRRRIRTEEAAGPALAKGVPADLVASRSKGLTEERNEGWAFDGLKGCDCCKKAGAAMTVFCTVVVDGKGLARLDVISERSMMTSKTVNAPGSPLLASHPPVVRCMRSRVVLT